MVKNKLVHLYRMHSRREGVDEKAPPEDIVCGSAAGGRRAENSPLTRKEDVAIITSAEKMREWWNWQTR